MASQLPHILLIGATGQTGKLVLDEALKRGHSVTALVRREGALSAQPGLTIVQGDPTVAADVQRGISQSVRDASSQSVVILSTLGQTRASGNPWAATTSPAGFVAASADAVISALASKQFPSVQKYIVMSMFGTRGSFKNLNFAMRAVMKYSNMTQTCADHDLVDDALKASDVNFVLVRAAMLKDGSQMPVKDLGDEGEAAGFMPSVTRQTVVAFMLDAAVKNECDGRTPVISN